MNSCFPFIYRAHQHGIANRRVPSRLIWLWACANSIGKTSGGIAKCSAVFSGYNLSHTYITAVYPSHWQTGPFTVWVNDSSQNCVYHYFVQISSSYRKTAAKVWNWYQRWLWRNGTQISVCPSGRTGLPFQMFRCSRTFSAGTTQKVVFHLLSKRMSLKLFVNFKQPT